MKKRIVFVMGCLENGGGERSLINLLQLIDYSVYEVDLVLFKERGIFMKQIPVEVNLLSKLDILHYLYADSLRGIVHCKNYKLLFTRVFGTLLSKMNSKSGYNKGQYRWEQFYKDSIPNLSKSYDIAVSYLEGETMFYMVDKINAKRKIAWVHTDYSKINADIEYDLKYFERVDSIVSISDVCVDVLRNLFKSIESKFVYLPNLINSNSIQFLAERFYPEEYKNVEGLKIVSVGRLIELKGFDMAIKAASELKKRKIGFHWFIIGDGILRNDLEKMKIEFDVEKEVHFIGIRENPYPYLKNADIVVQPSRYEGKSMVLDESKILNKPIVVTRYDTVLDQISEGEGLIVDMNADAIAQGIEQMISRKEDYIQFLSKNEYGNQKLINEYYKVFNGEKI